jgi:hypothetical protein
MTERRVKRNALNRGTCVYLGGSSVRFIWACGCTRIETVSTGRGRSKAALAPEAVRKLAHYWRSGGVVLSRCRRHPDWYSRDSQLGRLNAEHPQPKI